MRNWSGIRTEKSVTQSKASACLKDSSVSKPMSRLHSAAKKTVSSGRRRRMRSLCFSGSTTPRLSAPRNNCWKNPAANGTDTGMKDSWKSLQKTFRKCMIWHNTICGFPLLAGECRPEFSIRTGTDSISPSMNISISWDLQPADIWKRLQKFRHSVTHSSAPPVPRGGGKNGPRTGRRSLPVGLK